MREVKPFGKRQKNYRKLPSDRVLQETFAVVNNGCNSKQVIEFIAKTTGHRIKEIKEKMTKEELEKEAKERAEKLEKEQTLGVYDNDEDLARDEGFNDGEVSGYEEGFKDGAEFAYNKAKEDFTEQLKEVVETCNHWQEVAEKANEWHYVKDELPIITEKGRWLNLILKDRRVETFWWNFKSVPQRVIDNFKADVIAWKEIVLPELKESK